MKKYNFSFPDVFLESNLVVCHKQSQELYYFPRSVYKNIIDEQQVSHISSCPNQSISCYLIDKATGIGTGAIKSFSIKDLQGTIVQRENGGQILFFHDTW
ncbi:hypothetical protein [Haliscomenobacter hydrossis]|uniref:Uncharacterized protein n=1 Tax=Haliscomenobacter hydrossis (strain ATCC 27775 / DSM 1100 / LMG 10767 / O) TaxID=760192 RepID=F4L5Q4_HALH1|nr:hypothetical protein [Haliscomenobacter hydrossis]AEE51889.1 hypothetical protein Halhy_4041 [Haliscomenobacter hydrossis DSM 1100]